MAAALSSKLASFLHHRLLWWRSTPGSPVPGHVLRLQRSNPLTKLVCVVSENTLLPGGTTDLGLNANISDTRKREMIRPVPVTRKPKFVLSQGSKSRQR
jgi:hypothetical protein